MMETGRSAALPQQLDLDGGVTRRIWLVSPTDSHLDPMNGMPGPIQGFLLTAYTLSEYRTFEHVRIFVLNRKDVS